MSSASLRQAETQKESRPSIDLLAESLADLYHRTPELEEALTKHWYGLDQQKPEISLSTTIPSVIEDLTGEPVDEVVTAERLGDQIEAYTPTDQQLEGVSETLRFLEHELTGLDHRLRTDSEITPSNVLEEVMNDLIHSLTIAKHAFTTMTANIDTATPTYAAICGECGHDINLNTDHDEAPSFCPYCGEEYGSAEVVRFDTLS